MSPDTTPSAVPRTLLLATPTAAGQLAAMLAALPQPPRVAGYVRAAVGPAASGSDIVPAPAPALSPAPPRCLGDMGDLDGILESVRPDQVLISLPAALMGDLAKTLPALERRGITWRWMPTLADQLAGRVPVPRGMRASGVLALSGAASAPAVDPVQLLGRKPHPLDEAAIRRAIAGKRVLITGAGGSIGSELARMVCRFDPARLILVERAENALFEIDQEIGRVWPLVPRSAALHDIADPARTLALVRRHKPHVVFHAAAHKHVPMMEEHPSAAIENNFYGTRHVADAAHSIGAERFVMISTDKAVNPSSVMGASKRLAELYIQHLNARSETAFCMVRFGNVLGSACSVLPIWTKQLGHGGPVTVTHPDMVRYFMTIPEAAGLVIQAASYAGAAGDAGQVFLLDMGQPVRILDMARRFIRSHGFEPDVDIPVQITGVRPGEKLFEELAYGGEDMLPTPHPSIRAWRTTPPDDARMASIIALFDHLRACPRSRKGAAHHPWERATRDDIHAALHDAIPEMVAPASAGKPAPAGPAAAREPVAA